MNTPTAVLPARDVAVSSPGVCATLAGWFDLPTTQVRRAVAVLTVLTLGVAGLLYLLLWLCLPGTARRAWIAALVVVGLVGVGSAGAYRTLTTGGRAWLGEGGRPLANADVLLIEHGHVVGWTRTDADGFFRLWHAPGAHDQRGLAICARGAAPYFQPWTDASFLGTGYRVAPHTGRFPMPEPLAATEGVPATCRTGTP